MAGRISKYNDMGNSNKGQKTWLLAEYIRLSVEDGDDKVESNSIINQRALLNDYIKNNPEFKLYDYYVDDGFSGTDFNRPGFQRLLKDMKEKKFDAIIVKDLSRLGRNYIEVGNYIEQIFPLFDIRFIAVNDSIDSYKDPKSINNVIVPFKNLMNDEYCRDISNKIRSVFEIKKKNGEYIAAFAPYGYIKDPEDKHHLIVDQESATTVKLIFKWSLDGMGRTAIAHKLNELGILNPLGYRTLVLKQNWKSRKLDKNYSYSWDTVTINKILKDEVYCGDLVQNKGKIISYKVHKYVKNPKEEWIIVRNTHEAIIDRETFEKVQEAILSRDTRLGKDGQLSLFAGHIKCADCKRAMMKRHPSYYKDKPRKYYYYACSTFVRKSNGLCSKHSIRNDKLEEAVLEAIKLQISLVIDADKIVREIGKSKRFNYKMDIVSNNIDRQEKELDKFKGLKKSIYEDWKLGIIQENEYFEYAKEYASKIKEIDNTLQKLYIEKSTTSSKDKYDSDWAEKFMRNRNITELSKEVIDDLIEDIFVHQDGNITIKFKFQDEYQNVIEYIKQNEYLLENVDKK